jgi:phosphatidylserine/phosphatidylglycerophosphate/cardiolipin synthase-like enzyme
MHHKLILIDSRIVIFGSYNFTRSAEEKNDENVIIMHDPALAERFLIEFERLYTSARE